MMTQRPRRMARLRRRSFLANEDRQQFLVTLAFVGLIVVLVTFLVAAVALAYYNDNIRAVARVGSVEIGPGMVRERAALLRNRLDIRTSYVTEAQINGHIDSATAEQLKADIGNERNELGVTAIEGLIDTIYQSQLAGERGIEVTDADVEARMAEELAGMERRHVLGIFIEPQAADAQEGPTLAERRAARERAEQALAELESGRDFAEVAREYSTDESAARGGDLGVVPAIAAIDEGWKDHLFNLPEGGTTPVVAGSDGIYRIGRVVEILPREQVPGQRERLLDDLSEESYRDFLRYELAADELRDEVVAEALAASPEQIRLAHIFIEGAQETGDEEADEGEVHYSEVVYAPNDDLVSAPELPEDDPAWEEARAEAQATADELRAISDPEELAQRLAEIAAEESDSPSGEEGGDAGFTTRGIPPEPVAAALFDEEHEEGEIIGPVRGEAAYYVLLFHERRESPQKRVEAISSALAQPGADFAELARQHSDGESADEGGELGWFTPEMFPDPEIRDQIFALQEGEVSEPIVLGNGTYFFKALERAERPLDADQRATIRQTAFERWYAPKKDEAEEQGIIVRADDIEGEPEPGVDQGEFDETEIDLPADEE